MQAKNKAITYTEEQMADAFERRLKSRRPLEGIASLSQIFREVDCHRGRPDFVGLVSQNNSEKLVQHPMGYNLASARILSLLKLKAPRTLNDLAIVTGMTIVTIKRAMQHMQASGLVEELLDGSFVISGGSAIFEMETIAFELKLKNARRAVFQAQQYTLFAQRVWIVVPPSQAKQYDNYKPVLGRWGIGLATFNIKNHVFKPVIQPSRKNPGSGEHHAYAMLQLVGT